ncbi:probable ADP-ribosylation factor GTPase-activating protein AGD14 isoform X2 [Prosopis cineraria]|uniref:probable ADP-ribosylation factor GTPase-activating protein AGD14 isoform X2 n=1 Tax=Prosopis cineraria TaxID=364024 RepID=UPI00240EA06A|nr:probable ADP-ribosylation factor GTPase-activating protein AGD14 isoform X2 [Prosopis cineraria]
MANRLKEDEKNERIIRGLLKLPANRRCINCNSLGPQYVCTNFWTFVCTSCSGIHREFTHRVKSISMAKFTSQEVSALQEGGNQHAKEVYFKQWDPKSYSLPDNSNVGRLRNFIKQVYVDKRFTDERTYDKSQRGDKDHFSENSRVQSYQGGPKNPPCDDTYKHQYSDSSSLGGRSPGHDQESREYSNEKRSLSHPPIINDWRQEDRVGDERRFEGRRGSDGDYKLEDQLPGQANNLDSSSPPVVRSVRDILGENAVPLQINGTPETNSGKANDGLALTQRTVSSSSFASSIGNPAEVKLETTKSLIDFDDEPEPRVAPAIIYTQQTTTQSIAEQPNSRDDNNWASFDVTLEAKATQTPSNVNALESMLSQLSVSSSLPAHAPQVQHGSSVVTPVPGRSMTLQRTGNLSFSPAGPAPAPSLTATAVGAATISSFATFPSGGSSALQHPQPLFPPNVGQSLTHQSTPQPIGESNNQPWSMPPAPTIHGHPSMSLPHVSHLISKPATETSSSAAPGLSVEVKSSGRKELPEDLFTVKYYCFPAAVPGWHMVPPQGNGISMPYNTVVMLLQSNCMCIQPMPNLQRPSKSTNPFEIGNEPLPVQTTFPSRSSLQRGLPSVSTSGLMLPSSLSNPSLAWNPHGYGLVQPPLTQPHPLAMAPRPYTGQQVRMNMAMPRHQHQEIRSFGAEGAAFGFTSSDQHLTGTFSAPPSSNLSSAGRNPFG